MNFFSHICTLRKKLLKEREISRINPTTEQKWLISQKDSLCRWNIQPVLYYLDNTCLKRRTEFSAVHANLSHIWPVFFFFFFLDERETWQVLSFPLMYFSVCACFLTLFLISPKCFVFFPLNLYIHKEAQTLMAIIMFISSAPGCCFNISFSETSLNSCKLFPSGSLTSKHQVLCVLQT